MINPTTKICFGLFKERHDTIQHDEWSCPLCDALQKISSLKEALDNHRELMETAEIPQPGT